MQNPLSVAAFQGGFEERVPVVAKSSPFATLPLKTHGWQGDDGE
jgi:hypothetical protein